MQRFINTFFTAMLLASVVLWAGCGGRAAPPGPSFIPSDRSESFFSLEVGDPTAVSSSVSTPEWFTTVPEDTDYLYAATTATARDMQSAINKAKSEARMDIAGQLGTKVEGLFKRFQEEVGTGEDEELTSMTESISKEVVSEVISGCKAIKQETRTEGGLYRAYVLVKMSIWEANTALVDKVKANENVYARFKASQVFKELDKGIWEYDEVELSALDDVVYKAANGLMNADIGPDIRDIAVVEITRSRSKDKDAKARIALREALDSLAANRFSVTNTEMDADGRIFGRIDTEGRKQQLHLVMSEAGWEKTFTGYPYRSKGSAVAWSFIPGGGQAYNFSTARAIILGGLEIIGIGAAIKTHLDYSDAQDRYMEATKITKIDGYRDERDDLYNRRSLVSIAPAAIFLFNVCDAYLSARRYQKMRFSEE